MLAAPDAGRGRQTKGVDLDMYLAYLDPGTGSYLAGAVVAGFAGAVVAVRMYWRRLVGRFRKRSTPQD